MAKQKPVTPLDIFFRMGPKDPKRKADFDYLMLWIIFLAFLNICVGNLISFFKVEGFFNKLIRLGWSFFGLAIMWFQFHNLKLMRQARKQMREGQQKFEDIKLETKEEMLKEFK